MILNQISASTKGSTSFSFGRLGLGGLLGFLGFAFTFLACQGPDTANDGENSDARAEVQDGLSFEDTGGEGVEDEDLLYLGELCDTAEDCESKRCYGKATTQGHFEDASCRAECIPLLDFRYYCMNDNDCCRGYCCIGCGAKEGVCVLEVTTDRQPHSSTEP